MSFIKVYKNLSPYKKIPIVYKTFMQMKGSRKKLEAKTTFVYKGRWVKTLTEFGNLSVK